MPFCSIHNTMQKILMSVLRVNYFYRQMKNVNVLYERSVY